MDDELLTLEEVKTILKVHIDTLRKWCRTGYLPAIKLSAREYRVRRSDLNNFLEEKRIGPSNSSQ